jgi:hypothetical protein
MAKIEVTPETLAAMIQSAVAAALANAKADRMDTFKAGKGEAQVKQDVFIAKAFVKKGFKDVKLFDRTKTLAQQPDVTVLTYNKWMELGRKVLPGEHAVKYKQFRLFHKSQTRIATVEERKESFAKMQEAIQKYNDKKNGKAPEQPTAA